jgi:hypothetical protein
MLRAGGEMGSESECECVRCILSAVDRIRLL